MANDGRKKTFAQKAGRFVRRLTLCAAFAAAAGTGYNYFGTQEDITAKVTSVEPGPSGDLIRTDKGTFVNNTTLVFQKNQDDVLAIASKLTPGATVQLHVYGAHTQVAGRTLDDFGFYRNITDAAVIAPPPAPVVAAPPAPPVVAAPPVQQLQEQSKPKPKPQLPAPKPEGVLTVPADLVNADGIDLENVLLPEACVANDDLTGLSAKAPRLARDLDVMRQLPITGKPVYDMMKDPKNGMQTCLFPVPPKTSSLSTYDNNKHARIGRGTGTATTFHEYYHAMQNVKAGRNNMFTLTEKDAAVSDLLTEASAVAYEMASRQEAANHGLKFYDPPVYTETWEADGKIYTESYTDTAPATNPENVKVFKEAYDAAYALGIGLDDQAREATALQAGGQAVVRRLLQGADADWNSVNSDLVIKNINRNLGAFGASADDPGYVAQRDQVYRAQGAAAGAVNFVPDEFFGDKAGPAIEAAFNAQNFNFVSVKPPQLDASAQPAPVVPPPAQGNRFQP